MKRSGFTLIEIVIVLAIIAVLIVFLAPRGQRAQSQQDELMAQSHGGIVYQAVQNYLLQKVNKTVNDFVTVAGLASASSTPPGYTPAGDLYDCTAGVNVNTAVRWPQAPPSVRCVLDVSAAGERFAVVTWVDGHIKTYYVNGRAVLR
ncbi:hypothetical protein Ocepr_2362 (plasmid) [Oceanithermus profundus DSM 14977]|uniref:Prepilin-type N-terminal cleavage/methylation domain-containing protein n=1 Tax=Oceanithermus profundus (strain DSM 14977 / NBRC 100410 / VKM B-2274 / 506) TaxID=670487 RepID=E4UAN1_OCEP5|nr:type II secretion system protein [Oceanithermus profundus]ADR37810.1 hypothetical protein Ocepr_2362 [Oceanithermus profundus DSM 14977]